MTGYVCTVVRVSIPDFICQSANKRYTYLLGLVSLYRFAKNRRLVDGRSEEVTNKVRNTTSDVLGSTIHVLGNYSEGVGGGGWEGLKLKQLS